MSNPNIPIIDRDFIDFTAVRESDLDEIIEELRTRRSDIRPLVVDMFDDQGPDAKYKERAIRIPTMFNWLLYGKDFEAGNAQIRDYQDVSSEMLDGEGINMLAFSGKFVNLTEFIKNNTFESKFNHLVMLIQDTNIPIVGLCAGHQLYGIGVDGELQDIGTDEHGKKITIKDIADEKQEVLLPEHPVFKYFNRLANKSVGYFHSQHITTNDHRARLLAAREAPNGKMIANMFDHYDSSNPGKHILTFQFHPERLRVVPGTRNMNWNEQEQIVAGTALFATALYLLTSPQYTGQKKEFYN